MLSLLRWGLGSGPDHFDEKERLQVVEKMPGRIASPMEATRPPKRKRGDGVTTNGPQPKQMKRQPIAHARTPSVAMEHQPADSPRIVNSPGVLAQLAGRESVHAPPPKLVTTPSVQEPCTPPSLLTQTDLGVIDLTTPTAATAAPAPIPVPIVETSKLQQTIATEFGLEILLKHKELRMIDQELAKCQVALEQLRRCQTIPYPSQSADVDARLNVGGGVGRPIRTSHARQATHPPPWGIVDGPYSRHYARWLLPDPAFDGAAADDYALVPRAGKMLPDRHTRGSKSDHFLLASKRLRGVPVNSRLQALPAGYPEPKEHKGPMILKRAADDKLVKLVCLDCKREDFNSAQGFINHCRIAHSRGFASHEAAAQACGQEVEPSDVVPAAPVGTPADNSGVLTPSGGLVHPLVKPTVPMLSIPIPRAQRVAASAPRPMPRAKTPKPAAVHVGATTTPGALHLSKLFALAGRKDDLGALVAAAKDRTDLEAVSSEEDGSDDSEFDAGETSDASTNPPVMARMPSRGGLRAGPVKSIGPAARPDATKGVGRPNRRAAAMQADAHNTHHATLDLPDKSDELSPNTVESNNAPSLVSDNDDDDYEDGRTSTSPSEHSSDAEDDAHVDVDVEVEELPRLRGGSNHHLEPPRVALPSRKSEDPELQTSGNAKVVTRRGPRGVIVKPAQPKKRGRPRKIQP